MPPIVGNVGTTTPVQLYRAPQMIMRKSVDGGHTFGPQQIRDCGKSGEFQTRVRWLRLGRARDLVIEISVSDPIGWRLVDGFLEIAEGTGT